MVVAVDLHMKPILMSSVLDLYVHTRHSLNLIKAVRNLCTVVANKQNYYTFVNLVSKIIDTEGRLPLYSDYQQSF